MQHYIHDDIAVSWCFHFSVISLFPSPMYFQFDLTVQLSDDNISTRNLFQPKLNPHLNGVTIHGNLERLFSSGIARDPNAKQLCLEYFQVDFLN